MALNRPRKEHLLVREQKQEGRALPHRSGMLTNGQSARVTCSNIWPSKDMAVFHLSISWDHLLLWAVVPKPGWAQESHSTMVVTGVGDLKYRCSRPEPRDSYSLELW